MTSLRQKAQALVESVRPAWRASRGERCCHSISVHLDEKAAGDFVAGYPYPPSKMVMRPLVYRHSDPTQEGA